MTVKELIEQLKEFNQDLDATDGDDNIITMICICEDLSGKYIKLI